MQNYSNISNCIKMCERMLNGNNDRQLSNGNSYTRYNYKSRFDPGEIVKSYQSDNKSYVKRGECIKI